MRILIDCAGISVNSRITGIPRVTLRYITEGYRFGAANGITVLPVYVVREGVVDARHNLPDEIGEAAVFDGDLPANPDAGQRRALARIQRAEGLLRRTVGPLLRRLAATSPLLARLIGRLRLIYSRWSFDLAVRAGALKPVDVKPGDVIFMPAYWHDEYPQSYASAREKGARIVPLLHDVLPVTLAEAYEPGWREMFARYVSQTIALCDHVTYVSEATRQDFLRALAPQQEPPHSIFYHGFDYEAGASSAPVSSAVADFFSGDSFTVLMVGSIEPKKNHILMLEACRELWRRGIDVKLAIIGRLAWKSVAIEDAIESALGDPALAGKIAWFDDASDADLGHAYASAKVCVLASEAEGFGLPLIEALARKLPVIASDIPVFREIGGDHVEYVALDSGTITAALERLITDTAAYARAREKAATFVWPTWEDQCAKAFETLLRVDRRAETRVPD
jgi:alpha-1,2-rhamnosyltransferase